MGKKKGSATAKAAKSFGPPPPPEVVARFGPDPAELSETEAAALADLTARHESYTREQLLRFLRARDFDVDEAEILLEKCAEYEATVTRVSREEAFACIEHKWQSMVLLPKTDVFGRPVLYIRSRFHNPNTRSMERSRHFFHALLDEACATADENGIGNILIVFDLHDFASRNRDNQLVLEWVKTLQDFYPERLGHCVIVKSTWLTWAVYKVASVLMNPRTKTKIHFINDSEIPMLSQLIAPQHCPTPLGGQWEPPAPLAEPFPPTASGGGWFSGFFGGGKSDAAAAAEAAAKAAADDEAAERARIEAEDEAQILKTLNEQQIAEEATNVRRKSRKKKGK